MKSGVLLVLSVILISSVAVGEHIIPVGLRDATIQDIINIFYGIIAGTGVLMIVLHGIKWITTDNDEDRKQARNGVLHVLAGLILIGMATALVNMIYAKPGY